MLPFIQVISSTVNASVFAFGGLGVGEMLLIGMIAVMLFGKRLPEVARSLGKSYTQFRRGLHDMQSEIYTHTYSDTHASSSYSALADRVEEDDRDVPTAPKFEPPSEEPQDKS